MTEKTPPGDVRCSVLNRVSPALILLLLIVLALQPIVPNPIGTSAPLTIFSAARATQHLRVIASEPRPLGSTAHDRVRDYLEATLEKSGFETEVQSPPFENIIGFRAGTDSSGLLAICAHYDTVPGSPGAGDNGAAIVAMLETLRALGAAEPLRNDLLIVMTDAEETGLSGAQRFVADHPMASEIDVILNFDARGNRGPSLMFEAGPDSGWLIREFVESCAQPVTSSLMAEIYELMPNDTDFTIFKDQGVSGLNFAFIGGYDAYHSPEDTVDHLDPRSLQHHGEQMLALAHRLGQRDLATHEGESLVYFNVLGSLVILYSTQWVWPLAALALGIFVGAVLLGRRRGRIRLARLGWAFAAYGFLIFVVTLLIAGLSHLALWQLDAYFWKIFGFTSHDELFFAALTLLSVSATVAMLSPMTRRYSMETLTAAALAWWSLALVATCALLPGGSYLFLWPTLLTTSALSWALVRRHDDIGSKMYFVLMIPTIVAITPLLHLLDQALMLCLLAVSGPLLVLTLGLLWPILRRGAREITISTGIAGTLLYITGLVVAT